MASSSHAASSGQQLCVLPVPAGSFPAAERYVAEVEKSHPPLKKKPSDWLGIQEMLCKCGKDEAACGACGQGWAQRMHNDLGLPLDLEPNPGSSEEPDLLNLGSQRPPPKATHECIVCNEMFPASGVLICQEDPAYQWQEQAVIEKCLECLRRTNKEYEGEEGKNIFERQSTKARQRRSWLLKEVKNIRARTANWKKAKAEMEKEYGMSSKAYRAQLGRMAKSFCDALVTAMDKSDKKTQYLEAMRTVEVEAVRAAFDEDYRLKFSQEFLDDHLLQYADEIINKVNEHFICRERACGFVGPNGIWIQLLPREGKWKFRCPDCATRYHAWKEGASLIPAQKILVIDAAKGDPDPGLRVYSQLADLHDENDAEPECDYQMMLCEWPEIGISDLHNKFKQISMKLAVDVRKMEFDDISSELIKTSKHMTRGYMKDKIFQPSVRNMIQQLNMGREEWDISTVENGYKGFNYTYDPAKPILTSDDIMRMWGLVKYYAEASYYTSKL